MKAINIYMYIYINKHLAQSMQEEHTPVHKARSYWFHAFHNRRILHFNVYAIKSSAIYAA